MDGLRAREIQTLFRWFKEGPPGAVPIEHDQRSVGLLQAATWEDAGGAPAERLAAWHGSAAARQWLVEEVLKTPDRVLFWVKDVRGELVGHVGLSGLDEAAGTITVGDVVCGTSGQEGLMAAAVGCLVGWVHRSLRLRARREGERAAA
jgi:RimJ/RimL family protein N-acetyltransferase